MEVDVLPLAVSAVPDSSLLRLAGPWLTLIVYELSQADVGDAGGVLPDQVDVRIQDGGVDGLVVLGQYWRTGDKNKTINKQSISRSVRSCGTD